MFVNMILHRCSQRSVHFFKMIKMTSYKLQTLSDDESLCQRINAPELQQIFKVATASLEDSIELCTTLQAAMKIKVICPVYSKITDFKNLLY